MDKFSKFLLYAAIVFKLLLILVLTRYAYMRIFDKDNKKIEQIEVNKDALHELFTFSMYIILILVFNPREKNIRLSDNLEESFHLQLVIWALGFIMLFNFDYVEMYHNLIKVYKLFTAEE